MAKGNKNVAEMRPGEVGIIAGFTDEHLSIYVRQSEYTKEIISQLDEVYSPFEEVLVDKSGWILLTTDYRRPRSL